MHTKLLKFKPRRHSFLVTMATITLNNIFFKSGASRRNIVKLIYSLIALETKNNYFLVVDPLNLKISSKVTNLFSLRLFSSLNNRPSVT